MRNSSFLTIFFLYLVISNSGMPIAKVNRFKKHRSQKVKYQKHTCKVHKMGKTTVAMRDFLDVISEFASKALNAVVSFVKGVFNLLQYFIRAIAKDLTKVFDPVHTQGWLTDIINGILGEFNLEIHNPVDCINQNMNKDDLNDANKAMTSIINDHLTPNEEEIANKDDILKQSDLVDYSNCVSEAFIEVHNAIAQLETLDDLALADPHNPPHALKVLKELLNNNPDEKLKIFESIVQQSRKIMLYYNKKIQNSAFDEKPDEWMKIFHSLVFEDQFDSLESEFLSFKLLSETFESLHGHECIVTSKSFESSEYLSIDNVECDNVKSQFPIDPIYQSSIKPSYNSGGKIFPKTSSHHEADEMVIPDESEEKSTIKVNQYHKNHLGKHMQPLNLSEKNKKYLLQCHVFFKNDLKRLESSTSTYFQELLEFQNGQMKSKTSVWSKIKEKVSGFIEALKEGLKKLWEILKTFFSKCIVYAGSENVKNLISSTAVKVTSDLAEHQIHELTEPFIHKGVEAGLSHGLSHFISHVLVDTIFDEIIIMISFLGAYLKKWYQTGSPSRIEINGFILLGIFLSIPIKVLVSSVIPLPILNLIIMGVGNANRFRIAWNSLSEEERSNLDNYFPAEEDHHGGGHGHEHEKKRRRRKFSKMIKKKYI